MSRHPRGGAVAAWHSNKGKENAPAGMLDTLKASLDGKAGSATDAHETLLLASLRRRRSTETETAPTHAFPNVDASKLRDRELPAAAVAALRAWARGDLPGDHAAPRPGVFAGFYGDNWTWLWYPQIYIQIVFLSLAVTPSPRDPCPGSGSIDLLDLLWDFPVEVPQTRDSIRPGMPSAGDAVLELGRRRRDPLGHRR